jgi:hypothetical protein
MKTVDLFSRCQRFQKLAADGGAPPASFLNYLSQMVRLAQAAAASTNSLLALPQYQKSPGLTAFNAQLPGLITAIQAIKSEDDSFNAIDTAIANLSFFTDKSNAGTGYDPATWAKPQTGTAPAALLEQIKKINDHLKMDIEL